MSEPTNDVIASLARDLKLAISHQGQSTAGAVADAYETQRSQGSNTRKIVYSGGAGILAMLGTVTGWAMDKIEEWDTQTESVIAQAKTIEALRTEVTVMKGYQVQIGRRVVATELAVTDGMLWLGTKLDAGHSRAARKLPPPPTLTAAAIRAETVRRNRKLDELFGSDAIDMLIGNDPGFEIELQ